MKPPRPTLASIDPRAAREWGWLPRRPVPIGAVFVGPSGDVLKVNADGTVDLIVPPGHPHAGAASEPCHPRSTTTERKDEDA